MKSIIEKMSNLLFDRTATYRRIDGTFYIGIKCDLNDVETLIWEFDRMITLIRLDYDLTTDDEDDQFFLNSLVIINYSDSDMERMRIYHNYQEFRDYIELHR